MSDDPLSRDRFAIEQDIANLGYRIGAMTGRLSSGETIEQLEDVPDALSKDGSKLQRLASELASAWGKPR